MVQTSDHGGSCCGMRHIWQFREETTEQYIQDLIREMNRGNLADERLQLEVILSDKQTRDNPALVDNLARLGYVYTSAWTGGHDTPVHLFLRAKRRLALSAANFYNRWVNEQNGMLPHPDQSGTLPHWRDEVTPVAPEPDPRFIRHQRDNNLLVGDRVRIQNANSQYYRQEAQVVRLTRGYDGYGRLRSTATLDIRRAAGRQIELACSSLTIVTRVAEPVPPPAPEPVRHTYRHPTNPAIVPVQAQAAPERRLILSQFFCVFRNTGQASRVFSTLFEGQEAFPNARDWRERKVYSDGEIVEGPVQHG